MFECVPTPLLALCMVAITHCIAVQCNQSYFEPSVSSIKEIHATYGNRLSSCSSNDAAMECPPGLFCNNRTCKCAHYHYPYDIIKCDEEKGTSAILDCYCATFDEEKEVTLVGACIYNSENNNEVVDTVYTSLILNDTVCAIFNRTGALCGKCLPEHYPLAYSFDVNCIKCPHVGWNWGRYIMAAYIPLTLFCFLVFFFRINVVTSHLHPAVVFSQAVSISLVSRNVLLSMRTEPEHLSFLKVFISLHGIWNFDFFRPFYSDICLGISFLPTLALDYVIAVYPLLLMAITYLLVNLYDKNYKVIVILWKPFHAISSFFKRNWDIRSSLIDSFATFFLLSNIKFLSVTFDLLVPVPLYILHQSDYNQTWGLYSAGDMEYFGEEHLPYASLAISLLIVFVILPLIILSLYPFTFFQKLLNCIPVRWHILHTFMDSFNGCYKDGTEPGTRDCRWFAAVFFFARFICFIFYASSPTSVYLLFSAIFYMLLVLLIVNIQPFKPQKSHYSEINATFFAFLSIVMITICGLDNAAIKAQQFVLFFFLLACISGFIPLLYLLVLTFHWILSRGRVGVRLVSRIKAWRSAWLSFSWKWK